jgi:Flp pilus assembly pilin Flp
MNAVQNFFKNETGVASIEYAILAAVLVLALIAILSSIAGKVNNKMIDVRDNALDGY